MSASDPRVSSCVSCRVTGSLSLLAIAAFLASSRSSAASPGHRLLLTSLSGGLALLSVARAGDLPPF